MNLWRTLVFDQNISLRMIYREKIIQSLKNDAVKSGCECNGKLMEGLKTLKSCGEILIFSPKMIKMFYSLVIRQT